jgi:hypothetical protein
MVLDELDGVDLRPPEIAPEGGNGAMGPAYSILAAGFPLDIPLDLQPRHALFAERAEKLDVNIRRPLEESFS